MADMDCECAKCGVTFHVDQLDDDLHCKACEEPLTGTLDIPRVTIKTGYDDPKTFRFGDRICNEAAGKKNPQRVGTFVRLGNRRGATSPGPYVELTDRRGLFWQVKATPKYHRLKKVKHNGQKAL